jgi:hypothetical protein
MSVHAVLVLRHLRLRELEGLRLRRRASARKVYRIPRRILRSGEREWW